VPVL
jgi:dynein heavy chain